VRAAWSIAVLVRLSAAVRAVSSRSRSHLRRRRSPRRPTSLGPFPSSAPTRLRSFVAAHPGSRSLSSGPHRCRPLAAAQRLSPKPQRRQHTARRHSLQLRHRQRASCSTGAPHPSRRHRSTPVSCSPSTLLSTSSRSPSCPRPNPRSSVEPSPRRSTPRRQWRHHDRLRDPTAATLSFGLPRPLGTRSPLRRPRS
jgi:hypothetical protein